MTIFVDKSPNDGGGVGANTDQLAIPPAASSNGRIEPASNDSADISPNSSRKLSPLNYRPKPSSSPCLNSSWTLSNRPATNSSTTIGHLGFLSRKDGNVYSLATSGDLLYIGSESNNISVWKKGSEELSRFRSSSGLVKSIVVSGAGSIFTGHQDGKIRVWKLSSSGNLHKRVGTLPGMMDLLTSSMNPRSYLRRRHFDAVSSLALDEDRGLLYSGSWDKTFKVWRLSDSRCVESVAAHDDAINAVATSEGIVFTGSADGTVKAWRRPISESVGTKHALVGVMLRHRHGESAVTSLAVMRGGGGSVVYGGSSDGAIDFWEIVGGEDVPVVYGGVFRGHGMAVLCLATAGRVLVSGSADRSVRVWRRRKDEGGDVGAGHERVAVLVGHEGPVKCLAVEEEEEVEGEKGGSSWVVYSGGVDRSVKIWRVT